MAWTAVTSLLLTFSFHLVAVPLLGAVLLSLCCRVAGAGALSFGRFWKVYLAAVAYGLVLAICFTSALSMLHTAPEAPLAIQTVAICLTQFLVVTLLLELRWDLRVLLAEGAAVCATNLATLALLQSLAS